MDLILASLLCIVAGCMLVGKKFTIEIIHKSETSSEGPGIPLVDPKEDDMDTVKDLVETINDMMGVNHDE